MCEATHARWRGACSGAGPVSFLLGFQRLPAPPASPARHVAPARPGAPEGGSRAPWVFEVDVAASVGRLSSGGGRWEIMAGISSGSLPTRGASLLEVSEPCGSRSLVPSARRGSARTWTGAGRGGAARAGGRRPEAGRGLRALRGCRSWARSGAAAQKGPAPRQLSARPAGWLSSLRPGRL